MNLIVAVDANWGIGKQNQLLFSIPEDMAFFKETTLGKVVVMGRATMQSLPGHRPLKDRVNILLTSDHLLKPKGFMVAHSLEELKSLLAPYDGQEVFIIGGQKVYEQLLPYCRQAYVTKVQADGHADRHFPNLDTRSGWQLDHQSPPQLSGEYQLTFCRYINQKPLLL